ncbi:MAG: nucleotide exchange factor GrpE [Candidatus Thermoplasmatota archaeon]
MAEPQETPPQEPSSPVADGPAAQDQALATELAAWKDKAMRSRADYDNLSRRVARDAALERDRAKARVLEHFIPLNELAQMAAHQAEAHPGPLSDGVKLMAREFARLLEREGLTPIGTIGEAFNPAQHEAVATEAADGVEPGAVSRVIQVGYRMGDKVLRYAKVAVAPATVV